MRTDPSYALGCTLLASGFAWLLFAHFTIKLADTAVMLDGVPAVEKTNQYTGEEVRKHARAATAEVVNRIPSVLIPAFLMLSGAILLDLSLRKAKLAAPNYPR